MKKAENPKPKPQSQTPVSDTLKCPTCGAVIERDGDNDVVGCIVCGGGFCWDCGSPPEGICDNCGAKMEED